MIEKLTVLVVEDNPADVDLMRELLPKAGSVIFHIESVSRLSEALARLEAGGIDLALIDLGLPDSQGLGTFRKLRQAAPDLAMIVLTGNDDQETAVAAVREGAQDYLVKSEVGGNMLVRAARYAIERKRAEHDLLASETRYRRLFESAKDGILILDAGTGQIVDVNPFLVDLLGFTHEYFLGRKLWEIGLFKDIAASEAAFIEMQEKGYEGYEDLPLETRDGRRVDVEFISNVYLVDSTKVVQCNIRDVSERKRAEEERTRLAMAVEQAAEAILITDARGIINYVNPAFCRLTGYDRSGVIGQTPRIIHSGKQDGAFYEGLWATIRSGEIWSGRLVNMRKDGALFETEASISPVLNGAGEIVNYVGVERDVTESVALEGQIRHMQKMEAIGALAGGIAHDFNNVLAAIIGYGQMAADELPAGSGLRSDLDHILVAADRAKELVHQILTFSRQIEEARRSVEPHFIVRETLKLLRPSLPSTIEIRENIRGDSGAVLADVTQLHQVIMNLCTNAYHAMKDRGGILEIGLESCRVDGELARAVPELREQDYVRLSVRDTGCGMDDQTIRRIFDPFFTTKPVGEGTGMGLAITDSIVRAHGGAITVSSEVGGGTLFQVYLPRVDARTVEAPALETTVPGGHERILVVDDERNVVEVIERTLEGLGYQVTSVTSSLEALKIVRANPDLFDLVITDQTMPKLRGDQLAAEIHALRPNIPVIWITGYAEENVDEKTGLLGFSALIRKPWPLHAVARTVRQVLDGVAADCT
jgi:PAS domain S-box-containing protein